MKRFLLFAILLNCCVIVLSQQKQRKYELNFNLSEFCIKTDGALLSITTTKDFPLYLEDRSIPAIPYFPYRVLRPANMSASNYHVSYETELLYENVDIEGNPAILPTNVILSDKKSQSKATKSSDKPVIWGGDNNLYGYSYGFFKVSPFIYDSETKKLFFIPRITITFNDLEDSKSSDKQENTYNQKKSEDIKAFVLNSDELTTFYPQDNPIPQKSMTSSSDKTVYNGTLDYLIITSEALKNAFQPLKAWKIKKGLRTDIVTMESIDDYYAEYNYTRQEKLKRYIYLIHHWYNIKWVLLGGDNSAVPIQFCEIKTNTSNGPVTTLTPCDMYYGCLSTPCFNWDSDGNGIIGEFSDYMNLQQDVYVTRVPVSDIDSVDNFVQKVINYETQPTTPSHYEKMLFVGAKINENFGSISDAHYRSEAAYSQYVCSNWVHGHKYLYDTGSNISGYSSITPNNFYNLVNDGYHFIHNDTHGLVSSWSFNDTTSIYGNLNAESQTNSNPSIFITSSCHSNAFDQSCLSKALVCSSHGAIAYFGSSRSGLYYSGTTEIGPSLLYDSYFFYKLFTGFPSDGQYRFGAVAAEAKRQFADIAYSNETNGYRYLQFAINPLGDPELPIYTSRPYTFSNISITTNIANQVTVSTGGIDGCTIALVSADNGVSYFDVAEDVSSYTFTDVYAPCYVTVTKHNYKAYTSNLVHPTFRILGDADICGTNVYSVKDVSYGYTVTWSFANSSSPNSSLLQQDTPTYRQCTISNPNSVHINEVLIATVTKDGILYGTGSMNVSTGASFSAYFEQPGGTISGGSIVYPHITNTIHDSQYIGAFELTQLQFTSTDFTDCAFTFTGHAPSEWYLVGNTIYARFPSVGGTSKQCIVEGHQQSGCKIFKFYITVIPSSVLSNVNIADAVISASGSEYNITLQKLRNTVDYDGFQFDVDLPSEWNLSVANATTGAILYRKRVKGASTSFDTLGWSPGIYIIAYEINGKMNTKKIIVK